MSQTSHSRTNVKILLLYLSFPAEILKSMKGQPFCSLSSSFDNFTLEVTACPRPDMQLCCNASAHCSFLAGCADLWGYLIYLMYHAFDCIYSIAVTQDANKHIICSLITPIPLVINHCQ